MVNRSLKLIYTFFMGLVITSCSNKSFESKEDLWAYLIDTENGYLQEKEVNGIHFSLTYKPTDLLVNQELNKGYSEEEVNELRKKYNDYLYFNLSISSNGKELLSNSPNREEFGAMVNQLAFGMGQKLNLITQKQDTIALQDYAYPRLYGMGKSTDMLLVYERDSKLIESDFVRLTIEDLGYGTGEIAFKVPTKNLTEQLQLKF